jgi:hypothetical protein
MKTRVLVALYLVLWATIAAGVIYVAMRAGHSVWVAAPLAYLLFILVNGSLAYFFRARQLRREGKQLPSFLMYVFFPKGVRYTVSVPRPIRVVLGSIIFLGGLFLMLGGLMLASLDFLRAPYPFGAAAMLLVFVAMGAAFTYIGFRVIIVKDDQPLFKRRRAAESQINVA